MSLASMIDALRKEFKALGVPAVLEMAILSTTGKVVYSDLSKGAMAKISPFYNNMLLMGQGDNLSIGMEPNKTIIAARVSGRAILIALTDKKMGILLMKMGNVADKYGKLLDEIVALEESKSQKGAPAAEIPTETTHPPTFAYAEELGQTASIQQPAEASEAIVAPSEPKVPATVPGRPPAIVDEAATIIGEAQKHRVALRALGGIAVGIHCPSARHGAIVRDYPDIDLVGHAYQDRDIKRILTDLGFEPVKRFNAIHGRKRLKFLDPKKNIDIDVFLDVFEMCHKLNFKDRLDLDQYTIPLADLLMTKLQIVELNEKDVRDIIAILLDHGTGKGDPESIDFDYVAGLCSEDWGLWKTLTMNAGKISELVSDYALTDQYKQKVKSKLSAFVKRLKDEPKSIRWRMRARVGEATKWYETVEEVNR